MRPIFIPFVLSSKRWCTASLREATAAAKPCLYCVSPSRAAHRCHLPGPPSRSGCAQGPGDGSNKCCHHGPQVDTMQSHASEANSFYDVRTPTLNQACSSLGPANAAARPVRRPWPRGRRRTWRGSPARPCKKRRWKKHRKKHEMLAAMSTPQPLLVQAQLLEGGDFPASSLARFAILETAAMEQAAERFAAQLGEIHLWSLRRQLRTLNAACQAQEGFHDLFAEANGVPEGAMAGPGFQSCALG